MADKPTPIDTTNVDQINKNLDEIYNSLEWWRRYLGFDGNIPRIYYHGGDRIEELIARLRGEIAFIAKQLENLATEVKGIEDKFNDLLAYIDTEIGKQINDLMPEIVDKVVAATIQKIEEDLVKPTLGMSNGIPMLMNIIYNDGTWNFENTLGANYLTTAQTVWNRVVQYAHFDGLSNKWYFMQSDANSTSEGFVVIRADTSGNLIDQMYIKNGGHGQSNFFLRGNTDEPVIIFSKNGQFYMVGFQPNTTVDANTLTPAFPYKQQPGGSAAYVEQASGNAMVHTYNAGIKMVLAYHADWDPNSLKMTFDDTPAATINVGQYIDDGENILQGTTMLPKNAVTGGVDDGHFLIFLAYGEHQVKASILVLDYDRTNNTIEIVKNIDGLFNLLLQNDYSEREIEGISNFSIDTGVNGLLYGLTFVNGGGQPNKRHNTIYGIANSNALVAMRNAIEINGYQNLTYDIDINDTRNMLWYYKKHGTYTIRAAEFSRFLDTPKRIRGLKQDNDSLLENTIPDQNGDVMQRLIMKGYVAAEEVWERSINFGGGSNVGSDYKPTVIGPWNLVTTNQTRAVQASANQTSFQTTDVPGQVTYVTPNKDGFDYEGIDASQGYTVLNTQIGYTASELSMKQTLIANSRSYPTEYTRMISGVPDTYGSGFSSITNITPWHMTTPITRIGGFTISESSWTSANVSVRYKNGIGILEITATPSAVPGTDEFTLGHVTTTSINPAGTMSSYGTIIDVTSGTSGAMRIDNTGTVYINMGFSPAMTSGDYFAGNIIWHYDN